MMDHFYHQDHHIWSYMILDNRYNAWFLISDQLLNVIITFFNKTQLAKWCLQSRRTRRNNFKLLSSGFKTREYSLAWSLKLVVLLWGVWFLLILMEYRVEPRQQVLCISMGDVRQTSLDVMVTCVRFRSDVIRMKALCNHPKSNLGSCPFLIRPQISPFGIFYLYYPAAFLFRLIPVQCD